MYAIIDVETTGGSPAQDRIIEIAVFVFDGEKIVDQFSSLVNPNKKIDPYVTKLTGISDNMVKDAPTFVDIHKKVLQFLSPENIFVAHNVKFDYGMVRMEFKRMGMEFTRKQIDTVTLARKVLPGFNSYSLGVLCDSLGIKVENRHRAHGDAEATVKLLDLILKQSSSKKYIEIELNHGVDVTILPPHLSMGEIEKLPEEAGVFYFKDENDQVIFIDAAKNIRKQVISFFNKANETAAYSDKTNIFRQIDFQASGNELTARLLAYKEIRTKTPPLNKIPRLPKLSHAIFITTDPEGFYHLKALRIEEGEGEMTLKFSSKSAALKVLNKIIAESYLHVQFSLLRKITDPEQLQNFKPSFNEKIEKAVRKYLYKNSNFFIVGEGRRPDENSVVWIENSVYKGFGYIYPELTPVNIESLKDCIVADEDDTEIQKLIRLQLRKSKGLKIISY